MSAYCKKTRKARTLMVSLIPRMNLYQSHTGSFPGFGKLQGIKAEFAEANPSSL
jgi:hypothetical protein